MFTNLANELGNQGLAREGAPLGAFRVQWAGASGGIPYSIPVKSCKYEHNMKMYSIYIYNYIYIYTYTIHRYVIMFGCFPKNWWCLRNGWWLPKWCRKVHKRRIFGRSSIDRVAIGSFLLCKNDKKTRDFRMDLGNVRNSSGLLGYENWT